MKRLLLVLLAIAMGASMGAAWITSDQSLVMGGLETLKFEFVPNKDKTVGGPATFKVTDATIEFLKKHKTFTVQNDGQIELKK